MSSGDTVAAENYLQHAEHYNRIIMAAQAQNVGMPGMEGQSGFNGVGPVQSVRSLSSVIMTATDDGDVRRLHSSAAVFSGAQRPTINRSARPTINISSRSPIFRRTPSLRSSRSHSQLLLLHRMARSPLAENRTGHPRQEGDRMPRRRRRRPIGEHRAQDTSMAGAETAALRRGRTALRSPANPSLTRRHPSRTSPQLTLAVSPVEMTPLRTTFA